MAKEKKMRGHKRIWKEIDQWKRSSLDLDLDYLQRSGRSHTKIYVSPYSDLQLDDSSITEPKGATRKKILKGLLDIYDSWEQQLNTLDTTFYLKIWLYDKRFSKSQVVCAIGGMTDFYKYTFPKVEHSKPLNLSNYGALSTKMNTLQWEQHIDQDVFYDTHIGDPDEYINLDEYNAQRRWFKDKLKKPHKRIVNNDATFHYKEFYVFKMGNVWMGSRP